MQEVFPNFTARLGHNGVFGLFSKWGLKIISYFVLLSHQKDVLIGIGHT